MSEHIGWAKHNGAGEIIFRQACHPANEADLPAQGWRKVYVAADEARNHLQAVREFAHGLGASTATRAQILDACTRMPFAPEGES